MAEGGNKERARQLRPHDKSVTVYDVACPHLELSRKMQEEVNDGRIRAAFALFDTDGSGKISDVEMKEAVVKAYGKALDDDVFKKMMSAADTDGDGEIDLTEFKVIMRAGPDKK